MENDEYESELCFVVELNISRSVTNESHKIIIIIIIIIPRIIKRY